MTVKLTGDQLFMMLGKLQAELMALRDENGALRAALPPPPAPPKPNRAERRKAKG